MYLGRWWTKDFFQTRYNHFKYIVMFFDLVNAHAIFQHLMNNVFCEYLDDFLGCYINDILISWLPHFLFMHTLFNHSCYIKKWFWFCIRCHTFTTWKWQLSFLVKINFVIHDKDFLAIMYVLRNGIIYSKFKMKSLCILIFFYCSCFELTPSSMDLFCSQFGLSSHIILSTNNKNHIHYPIIHTLHLKMEMKFMTNNMMSSSSPNILNCKHYE